MCLIAIFLLIGVSVPTSISFSILDSYETVGSKGKIRFICKDFDLVRKGR